MTTFDRSARWANPNHNPPATCTVDGCERVHVARGFCRMHYTRYHQGKPIGTSEPLRNPDALCAVEECGRRSRMYGYCTLHGQRYRTHGDPGALGWGSLADETETILYRLWGNTGDLLYIGVTVDLPRRFGQHAKVQSWWPDVVHHSVEVLPTRSAAFDAERLAVERERPRHNVKLARF